MPPLCADQGIGVIPWSPLARGVLTRDWDSDTDRSRTDVVLDGLYPADSDREIVARVAAAAAERGVSRAQVALAWVMANPVITARIVGVTKLQHLSDALTALDLTLTEDELDRLAEPYTPRRPVAFS